MLLEGFAGLGMPPGDKRRQDRGLRSCDGGIRTEFPDVQAMVFIGVRRCSEKQELLDWDPCRRKSNRKSQLIGASLFSVR